MITASLDLGPLLRSIDAAAKLTDTSMETLIRQQARLFIFNSGNTPGIINLLPPFSAGRKGKEGLAQGKNKIDSDLAGIFAPVSIKGQRLIKTVFGRPMKEPVYTPTKETWPDVQAVYDTRNARRHGGRLTRGQKGAFYVDRSKLMAVRKKLYSHIGWAAAAWYRASLEAGLNTPGIPAWIKRHSAAPGTASINPEPSRFTITFESDLSYSAGLDMPRKVAKALEYRENALARQMPYIVRAALKKAGFSEAA